MNQEKFHVADRNVGTLIGAISIAATWAWAPAMLVAINSILNLGYAGFAAFFIFNVFGLMVFSYYTKKIDMSKYVSFSECVKDKLSKRMSNVYNMEMTLLSICCLAVQFVAVKNMSELGLWLFAGIVLGYSLFLGFRISVWTDVIQYLCIVIALGLSIWYGPTEFSVPDIHISTSTLLAFAIPTALGVLTGPLADQCFWQRAAGYANPQKAFFWGALMFGIIPPMAAYIGVQYGGVPQTALWTVALVGVLSSTADSALCALPSLYNMSIRNSRITMVIHTGLALLIAYTGVNVTQLFLIYGVLRMCMFCSTTTIAFKKQVNENMLYYLTLCSIAMAWTIYIYASTHGYNIMSIGCSLLAILLPFVSWYAKEN